MTEEWLRVRKFASSFSLKGSDSFRHVVRDLREKNEVVCFEHEGHIYLVDLERLEMLRALDWDGLTVTDVIQLLNLEPSSRIFKEGERMISRTMTLPRNRRLVVLTEDSVVEVWERKSAGDRGGSSGGEFSLPDDKLFSRGTEVGEAQEDVEEGIEIPRGGGGGSPLFSEDFDYEVLEEATPPAESAPQVEPPESTEEEAVGTELEEDLLGGGTGAHPPPDAKEGTEHERWINASLKNHRFPEPLEKGNTYNLEIAIESVKTQSPGALISTPADPNLVSGKADFELVVELLSDDQDAWEFNVQRQKLYVRKDGLSIGAAVFQITPQKDGPIKLAAIIHRDNNLVQRLDISIDVGTAETATVTALRQTLVFPPRGIRRDVMLIIEPENGYYTVNACGDYASKFDIKLTTPQLDHMVEVARNTLLAVVRMVDTAPAKTTQTYPFQSLITIPPAIEKASLAMLAEAGQTLFYNIFLNDLASDQCRAFGNWLIEEANRGRSVRVQVNAELFTVPWGMLYPQDPLDPASFSWERFLGMRCVIEQTPLKNSGFRCDPDILEGPTGLSMSLNVNWDLDKNGAVTRQIAHLDAIAKQAPKMRFVQRGSDTDVVTALGAPGDDQIFYMYCHADTVGLNTVSGPGASTFTFTGDKSVSLNHLNRYAPSKFQFTGAPLVFINACESGAMSSGFYGGFVSYFIGKGARGVIGTECKVPAMFAEEWAKRFFTDFLTGNDDIGTVMLKMRQHFVNNHGNGLGLLYGLHCNADTLVAREEAA